MLNLRHRNKETLNPRGPDRQPDLSLDGFPRFTQSGMAFFESSSRFIPLFEHDLFRKTGIHFSGSCFNALFRGAIRRPSPQIQFLEEVAAALRPGGGARWRSG